MVAIFWWPHLVVLLTCWTGDEWGWTLASEKSYCIVFHDASLVNLLKLLHSISSRLHIFILTCSKSMLKEKLFFDDTLFIASLMQHFCFILAKGLFSSAVRD